MQAFGSMYSISVLPKAGSSGVGWMQLTGQTDTQVASAQQFWVIAKAMADPAKVCGEACSEQAGHPVDTHRWLGEHAAGVEELHEARAARSQHRLEVLVVARLAQGALAVEAGVLVDGRVPHA